MPSCFLDVLIEWGSTWLLDSLWLFGEYNWPEEAIRDGTCLAVTYGLYVKELYPELWSGAFVLECSKGRGNIFGSFPEQLVAAGDYQGEILGLMAIHLIFMAENKVNTTLQGRAKIYSECLDALGTMDNLPANLVYCRWNHSDILKNIMVKRQDLNFACSYSHVKAHQDGDMAYQYLSCPSYINCIMYDHANNVIWGLDGLYLSV